MVVFWGRKFINWKIHVRSTINIINGVQGLFILIVILIAIAPVNLSLRDFRIDKIVVTRSEMWHFVNFFQLHKRSNRKNLFYFIRFR